MNRVIPFCLGLLLTLCIGIAFAADDATIDRHIQELKSPDAAVRATAAYDLGCG
jgi:hypothetical protein